MKSSSARKFVVGLVVVGFVIWFVRHRASPTIEIQKIAELPAEEKTEPPPQRVDQNPEGSECRTFNDAVKKTSSTGLLALLNQKQLVIPTVCRMSDQTGSDAYLGLVTTCARRETSVDDGKCVTAFETYRAQI